MNISDVISEVRELKFPYKSGVIELTYHPEAFTPEHEEKQLEARDNQSASGMLIAMLTPMIITWNLTHNVPDPADIEAGVELEKCRKVEEPIPVSPEGYRKIPIPVLSAMMKAIGEDNKVPNDKKSNSVGTFA